MKDCYPLECASLWNRLRCRLGRHSFYAGPPWTWKTWCRYCGVGHE